MQASIHEFDNGGGSALLDDGRVVTIDPRVFETSALRHLRPGQRVSLEIDETSIPPAATKLWVVGIGDGQVIR